MLSEVLQQNAKPRKRHDFRHPNDGLYEAKHEARLSNISGFFACPAGKNSKRFFAPLRMTIASRAVGLLDLELPQV